MKQVNLWNRVTAVLLTMIFLLALGTSAVSAKEAPVLTEETVDVEALLQDLPSADYTGFLGAGYVWVYVENGQVDFQTDGLFKGEVNGETAWWYVQDSFVRFNVTAVVKIDGKRYYINQGKYDASFTGIAAESDGTLWRMKKGRVQKNANGLFKGESGLYVVKAGKVQSNYNGPYANTKAWYVVENGKVNTDYSGSYKYGKSTFQAKNGKITGSKSGKIIYLTFDDGPGPYTDKLLTILDKYNVKATFFVTHAYPNYQSLIKKEKQKGHTVAIHTYTHNYANIYRSTSNYWNDFNRMQDAIVSQTGQTTTLFRFPGGSSNTVSRSYCSGIMSALVKQSNQKGYTYFDWNGQSGDAGVTTSTSGCYSNMVKYASATKVSVMLCHDVKGYSVNAIGAFIEWGLAHGYVFMPLTSGSPTCHQGVNN